MNLLWESRTETGDTKAFQEAIFISVLAAAQQIHIQSLSPENKGVLPYIPSRQVTEARKNLIHIWLYTILLATLPSVLCDLFHVQLL
jgi:hypothetical protein